MTRLAALAVALALGSACAAPRRFPDAPILIVCPWAAGGGTDRVARQMAALLEQDLGVPVNVVNATGGEGVTGHSRGALARPDGYTLTLLTIEIATLHWRGMTSISPGDFAPVGLVNRDAAAIFVRADAPWRTLRDLEEAVRRAPRRLRASGTATAGIWHLALAGWLSSVGLGPTDVIWVSIAGSAPSLQELLAGGIDVVSCSLPEAQALLSAGRIRSLGVMADARVPQFPDVPTLKEQGVDWTLGTLRGLGAPKDTPPERVQLLAAAVRRVVEGDGYRSAMLQAGFTPAYEDPRRLASTLAEADRRLGGLLRSEAFRGLGARRLGPMFFPAVLLGALALVSLALVAAARRAPARDGAAPAAAPPGAGWRFAEVLVGIALYVALAETFGFVVTAGVLLLAHLVRLRTHPRVALPLVFVLVPASYHLFAVVLRVPLPRGLVGW
ncbi:MAG TPA: tripartite tricarboxylate transporter substrate-binding protein [Vicinamibacteria bacterium]|nr:tripartite tricarboxylate transporter substrate-binding protein [Vicinamibacteria bacterium]